MASSAMRWTSKIHETNNPLKHNCFMHGVRPREMADVITIHVLVPATMFGTRDVALFMLIIQCYPSNKQRIIRILINLKL